SDGASVAIVPAHYKTPAPLPARPHPLPPPSPAGTTATAVTAVPVSPILTLTYNGKLRDRVGQGNTALAPDGSPDGTLTATLSAAGGRTITALRRHSDDPGTRDTRHATQSCALALPPSLRDRLL